MNEINRAMPGRPEMLDARAIELALGGGTLGEPTVPSIATDRLVSNFGEGSIAHQREDYCRAQRDPGAMRQNADDRTGCGLYFRANPDLPSTIAYGTRRGPMSSVKLEKTGVGEWIWDPQDAGARESSKMASRIHSCPDIAYATYPNMGWCTSTHRAIAHDGNGNPRYPRAQGGDCPGGTIITSAAQCPPPPPPDEGGNGVFGRGSGSPSIASICQKQPNGSVTPACIRAVNNQVCSPQGLLSQSLAGAGYAAENQEFNGVNSVLVKRGFEIPAGILRDGKVTTEAVVSSAFGLQQMAAGSDPRSAAAASRMCYGTPFDPCGYQDGDAGPFDSYCITRQATQQGWSPHGQLLTGNDSYWSQFTNWGAVKNTINWWKGQADTPQHDQTKQSKSIMNVYGISVKYPFQGCNTQGVAVLRYSSPSNFQDSMMPANGGIQTHFLGRYIFKNGLPAHGGTLEDQTPAGSYMKEVQRMITYFQPPTEGNYQFMILTSNWVRMSINDTVFAEVRSNPTGATTSTIQFHKTQTYKLTWDFANKEGVWSFNCQMSVNGGGWQPIPADALYLPVDRRKALLEFAFNKMPTTPSSYRAIWDSQQIFDNFMIKAPIGQLAGRQCMIVDGQQGHGVKQGKTWGQGIRAYALKSYTAMLNISSIRAPSGVTPFIFGYYNTNSANPDVMQGPKNDSSVYSNQKANMTMTTSGNLIYAWGKSATDPGVEKCYWGQTVPMPNSQWFHLAWVWDADLTGYSIWINGKMARHVPTPSTVYSSQIMEQIRVGMDEIGDGTVWTGGMAWFRGFDYQLSADDIQRDMRDDWESL